MSFQLTRISIPVKDTRNQNIYHQYPAADNSRWIWYPGLEHPEQSAVELTLDFDCKDVLCDTFHISGDYRYEFFADGQYIGMGPDRCDKQHWSFASYKAEFSPGHHTLRAFCWAFKGQMPVSDIVDYPGFLLGAEKNPELFNTGTGAWKARLLNGISFGIGGWAIGGSVIIDVAKFTEKTEKTDAAISVETFGDNLFGVPAERGKKLYPSRLREQIRVPFTGKKTVRAVIPDNIESSVFVEESHTQPSALMSGMQALLDGKSDLTIPAGEKFSCIVDFETYLCSYPTVTAQGGGKDSLVRIALMESLFCNHENMTNDKKNRNEITGKWFNCQNNWASQYNQFCNFTDETNTLQGLWWLSGRYAMITVSAGEKPLVLKSIKFMESRYPVEAESSIHFEEPVLNDVQTMMIRVLQSCMHETYMDCPYYEQQMYVGDTRLEALTTYSLMKDAALPYHAIELFGWSRSLWDGLTSGNFPTDNKQMISTYSMIWPWMIQDYLMYRRFADKNDFRRLRTSIRATVSAMFEYVNDDGLIENLPGWSFVDWVPGWNMGIPFPGTNNAASALFTLHYLMALKSAMDMELEQPDPDNGMYACFKAAFDFSAKALKDKFFIAEKNLFADDLTHEHFSAHAQCLALICGVLTGDEAKRCYQSMLAGLEKKEIAMPTLYFIYYLFETMYRFGEGDKLLDYVYIWSDMMKLGAVTTWETPEPTRSDCHAWGAHLYHHYFASIAGIRPVSAGFRTVRVAPAMGRLKHVTGKYVHPDGMIAFDFTKGCDGAVHGTLSLPDGCKGEFVNNGRTVFLNPGMNQL